MNFYNNTKALPNNAGDVAFQDSLEIQIMEDPSTTAYIDITGNEMQKQIDAFTGMMREKSENPSTAPRESNCSNIMGNMVGGHNQSYQAAGVGESDEKKFQLEDDRYLTVSKFRGKHKIHIRDFYRDRAGVLKATKKGIALTPTQWSKIKTLIKSVDLALYDKDVNH